MADGRLHGDPGRRVGLVDVGAARTASSTSTGCSRCSTAPTSAASASSSAPRRTRCRRGWPAGTPRSPARPRTGERDRRGAAGRRSTTRHPAFRFHAERVIRKIVARYADHPAVIGFQVDNEPGLRLFHNHGVFQRFVDDLRQHVRRRRDAEPRRGVWSTGRTGCRTWADLWTPGRQHPAAVRPGLAALPGRADHRVHRLAGRHRPRVRPRRPVRHHLHRLRAAGGRRRRAHRAPRRDRRQPLLRDAGRPRAARHPHAATSRVDDVGAWALFT